MTPTKPPKSTPRASPRIACYGTAFLADAALDAKLLIPEVAADARQFSSPRLDASFLIDCARLLTGGLATMESAPSRYVKRVAGTDFHSPKTTVLYSCSIELRELLGALTDERAAEMATERYGPHRLLKDKPAERNGRTQRHLAILNGLASLARHARLGQTTLMLRVEYRKQR